MNIADKYITELKNAYINSAAEKEWMHFESIKEGASKKDIDKLKKIYPLVSKTLINILQYVDGTYWREYKDEEIAFYFLGSDIEEYPYYLLSVDQIIEDQNQAKEYYAEYIERQYDDVQIDEKITNLSDTLNWLHFSDCMNNGGTSQLFIDFSPSEKGKLGQVVRFIHDPDEFKVIADSFDEYLQILITGGCNFINESDQD